MSSFKIALTTIFAVCIVVGLALFAVSKANSGASVSHIKVWGTIPEDTFAATLKASSLSSNKLIVVSYVRKDPATFDADFVEALSNGEGPDVVMLRDDQMYKNRNKLFVIPYKNYTERLFKDTFLEEGEVNLTPDGITGLPFMVDPLVMYWNRDLFSNNLLVEPPKYWDEFYGTTATTTLIAAITHRDSAANITQSALSFGEWNNVTNAKEILAMLFMQAGTPITQRGSQGVVSVLNSQLGYPIVPSYAAVNFYTQFSNPTAPSYTWNRSLPASLVFFLSGKLATYIGFSSEIFNIQDKNPNLNFDVTYVPQIRQPGTQTPKQTVFAHLWSLAIVKQSKQIAGAYGTVVGLTESGALSALGQFTDLPPVRRDLLAQKPTDAYRVVFYNSALLSHTWIDPDGDASSQIFHDMIDSITSGRARTSEALRKADEAISALLK